MTSELLKRAEPTFEDVMTAKWIAEGHLYWAETLSKGYGNGATDVSEEARDYRRLLEIVACRERQLEIAVSLLNEKDRQQVGV